MFDTKSSVPLHTQASNYMRDKIYSHEWESEKRIPSEFELAEELSMSRGTVKKAIKTLVDEGLLVQVRGKGTYVKKPRLTHPSGGSLLSFAESLDSQGISFETKVLGKEVIPADAFLSEKLQIPVGAPVFFLRRVRTIDGVPVMYIENRLNIGLMPGLDEVDFEKERLFGSIEKCAEKRIGYSRARYAAKVAGEERGRQLKVPEDSPVLHLEQHIFFEDNSPAEWGNVWLRANSYVVGTVLQRN